VKGKNALLLFVFDGCESHSRALCGFPNCRGDNRRSYLAKEFRELRSQ
jgi:hypothetical protein